MTNTENNRDKNIELTQLCKKYRIVNTNAGI